MKNLIEKLQQADRKSQKDYEKRIKQGKYAFKPQNFITKSGTLNKHYSNALSGSRFVFKTKRIYPCYWSGSGNYINLKDYTVYVTNLLSCLGYKYSLGNDAPRGGRQGDYIQVSPKAYEALTQFCSL